MIGASPVAAQPVASITITTSGGGGGGGGGGATLTRPNSNITVSGWTGTPDNTLLYTNIDEFGPIDSDFITSSLMAESPGPAVFGLSGSMDAGTYDIRVRAKRTSLAGRIRILLLDSGGSTVGTSSYQTLTTDFITYALTVTTTGVASRIRVEVLT